MIHADDFSRGIIGKWRLDDSHDPAFDAAALIEEQFSKLKDE